MARFIRTFESPMSAEVVDFWQQVVNVQRQGSGNSVYTGWITAFCFWDQEGLVVVSRLGTHI